MTLIEAINRVDALKPNAYTQTEKVGWLSTLDGMIKKDIIDTHECAEAVTFNGYDDESGLDTVLIAEETYTDMYIAWLESKIDYFNGEITRYNNSITRFNELYNAYQNAYNRSHLPVKTSISYF